MRKAGLVNVRREWKWAHYSLAVLKNERAARVLRETLEWLKEDELDWVNNRIQYNYSTPGDPCSQLPQALKEMLDKNVSREAIIDLIRVIQYETLFHVCSTIDRTYEADTPVSEWSLYQLNDNDDPTDIISGLHESLLEFDPSANEMRPRKQDGSR